MLGLGASSNVIVERWNGIPFRRPLAKVEETVEYLRTVLAGERGTGGFKLASPPDESVPIVLAALRDRMLGLAARVADGAFTWRELAVEPSEDLARPCRAGGDPGAVGDDAALDDRAVPDLDAVPEDRPSRRQRAFAPGKRHRRPVVIERRADVVALVREVFLLGSVEAQRERLAEFARAGITTAVLALFCSPGQVPGLIDEFAPD